VKRLAAHRLSEACGFRHGIVPPVDDVVPTFAELRGFHNAFIDGDTASTRESSAGGFARTVEGARAAAIAEALERYSASLARMPHAARAELAGRRVLGVEEFALFTDEQRRAPGFAWPGSSEARYAQVFSLADNHEAWAPQELVGLGSRVEPTTLPSTSTGLAAAPDPFWALLSAVEELLERDAFAVYWLNALPGRELALPAEYRRAVEEKGGEARAFDLTQAWNPHPVVAVCGNLPLRGLPRYSLGAACRPDYPRAVEKAFLEWLQGTVFAGYYLNDHPGLDFASPSEVRDFQQHGAYYTARPHEWARLPILRAHGAARPLPPPAPPETPADALASLVRALAAAGVRLYYRDLTLPDVADVGLTVVRALSPELALLHGDEQAPFFGGRARDVRWRWPELEAHARFPNPLPHPLG
jgi:ribosomal protein S12 methylthiotransferase accessory factor